jgi:hypothetical protein
MSTIQAYISPEQMARIGAAVSGFQPVSTEAVVAAQNAFRQQQVANRFRTAGAGLSLAPPPVYTPPPMSDGGGSASDPAVYDPSAAYDMSGPAGPYIDSRMGGIPGRVVRLKETTQAIEDEPVEGTPFEQSVAFSQDDQEVLGSTGRRLVAIIGYANVSGDLPDGYDAATLIRVIQDLVKIQVLVSGQIKDETPLTLARDTGFDGRLLRTNIILDPGAFNTTRLQFSSGGSPLPPAPSGSYTVRIGAQCIFAPLSRTQRAAAGRVFDQL